MWLFSLPKQGGLGLWLGEGLPNVYLGIHVLAAGCVVVDHGGALVTFVCYVQSLQQFVHLLQDIGGQHVA